MAQPLLNLTTAPPDRQHITIDGSRYYLAETGDITLEQVIWLEQLVKWIQALGEGDVSAEDAARCAAETRRMAKMLVLGVEDEVFDKLGDMQALAIIEAFHRAAQERGSLPAAEPVAPQDGATSSPGSNASTAAPEAGAG